MSRPKIARRRLYKPERAPARKRGVIGACPPQACPDASSYEIAMAIDALCEEAGFKIGRGSYYDRQRDEYWLIGKSLVTGKAQDTKVHGFEVAVLIQLLRQWNGGRKFDKQGLTKRVAGLTRRAV